MCKMHTPTHTFAVKFFFWIVCCLVQTWKKKKKKNVHHIKYSKISSIIVINTYDAGLFVERMNKIEFLKNEIKIVVIL